MIGVTIGDPNGVGPEILLRAFIDKQISGDFIAIGDYSVLEFCIRHLGLNIQLHRMKGTDDYINDALNIHDAGLLSASDISIGKISKKTGSASLTYVELATKLALNGRLAAFVTLPVNKEAIRQTLPEFSGHTGYIASMCKVSNYTMMLVSDKLIVTHVSTHVSLRQAIENVRTEKILQVIRLTDTALRKLGKRSKIAVAGLNPHAGENNSFGIEDSREIAPAVNKARDEGIDVTGPLAADTVFYLANKGNFDAVVCMYHDQGHIPIKLLDFESAVNVTLGLPVIRTSVDHGTAFDIAYRGFASTNSFCNAYELAKKLI